MGVVLAGGKVEIGAPGEGEGSDGRSLGSHMDADVGEVCPERGLHLGLHIAGQRPSARLRAEIDLEGIDSGTALDRRLLLYRAVVDRGKGKGAGAEESLHHPASAAGNTRMRDAGRGRPGRTNTKSRRRLH